MKTSMWKNKAQDRRHFIGGSDARIIMGTDEDALVRLWQEKRGEIEPEDLSGNLIVQLGLVTEDLNRHWYEANTGQVIVDMQRRGVRVKVHAAVVVLGRNRSCEVHAAAAAQYVGGRGTDRGAVDHYGGR